MSAWKECARQEVVAVQQQNLVEFRLLLRETLAIDPDEIPELRLENTIAQRRAKWLETRIPVLFVNVEKHN